MKSHSLLPQWRPPRCFRRSSMPTGLFAWLLHCGSMTAHLQKISGGTIYSDVHQHCFAKMRLDEARKLKLSQHTPALVREVHLYGGGQAWLYARSICPARSLQGPWWRLRRLGSKPIGSVIFRHPQIQRSAFEVARLHAGHRDYVCAAQQLAQPPDYLWARRSLLQLKSHCILVMEVFLPAIAEAFYE